jgi:hypothetical protein
MRARTLPKKPNHLGCLVCVICLSLCACATDAQKTQGQGAGAGAVLGALIGVAVTHDARGALIGGAAGGLTGLGVGTAVAQKKAQYAARENTLHDSAQRAEQLAQQVQQRNQQLSGEVARLDATVQNLRTQEMSAEARRALLDRNQRSAQILLSGVDLQLQQVKAEIVRQQAVLTAEAQQAQQTQQASPADGVRLVQAGIRDLESDQRALEQARAQLALIDPRRAY